MSSPSRWPERHGSEVDEWGGDAWRSGPIGAGSVLGSPRPSVARIRRLGSRGSTRSDGIGLGRLDRSGKFGSGLEGGPGIKLETLGVVIRRLCMHGVVQNGSSSYVIYCLD
jgi:hypothetical protein